VTGRRDLMLARIYITLKAGVLDPQGISVKNALNILGYREVEEVRIGKYIELYLNCDGPREECDRNVRDMCERLLANPVIEDYFYELIDGK